MVVFTIASQILDTVLLKGTSIIIGQTYDILSWGGIKLYRYYIPPPRSREEILEQKIKDLEHKLNIFTNDFEKEYIIINDDDFK